MLNNKKHTSKMISPFLRLMVVLSILLFTHFTFAIQYINLTGFGLSLTEIVEEEEKEEHKNDLLENLVNDSKVISSVNYELTKETLVSRYPSSVLTPPPEQNNAIYS